MIGVVDYGLGNVKAFENIYKKLNLPVKRLRAAADFSDVERLILPGVGAFDHAMSKLNESGIREPLEQHVRDKKLPVLGVCVGMQMMAEGSEEGKSSGLGWIPGTVRKFSAVADGRWRLPHMGWNNVSPTTGEGLYDSLDQTSRFYFLHSYYFDADDGDDELSKTDYFGAFSSSVTRDNVYGVQFHPEKSHSWGECLLRNFACLSA